jgi:hypothetical protein
MHILEWDQVLPCPLMEDRSLSCQCLPFSWGYKQRLDELKPLGGVGSLRLGRGLLVPLLAY